MNHVYLYLSVSLLWFSTVSMAGPRVVKPDINISAEESARRFVNRISRAGNLVDFIKQTPMSSALMHETLDQVRALNFDDRKSFPKCSRKATYVTCGDEVLHFTEHGLVLNGVGVKFHPHMSFAENLDEKLRDLGKSMKAPGAKSPSRSPASASSKTIVDPIAAVAVVVDELAYFDNFMFGKP